MGRPYSIVVFGATGFTGKRVADYLISTCPSVQYIALAGRSRDSLEKLAKKYETKGAVDCIVANVDDNASLVEMAQNALLVLDCVGPYRYWGEAVVKACIEAGTHFLDISGEPDYIERMEFKYNEAAKAAGVYVVSGAGLDSIPADLGTLYTQRLFKPPSVPCSVESFMTIRSGSAGLVGNLATWESAVMGFGAQEELSRLRAEVRASGKAPKPAAVPGPNLKRLETYAWDPRVNAYIVPFVGSDASIVRRSQMGLAARGEPGVRFAAYLTVPSAFYLFLLFVCGTLLKLLSPSAFGRSLLLTFPSLFSFGVFRKGGPSQAQLDASSFTFTFIAQGYSRGLPASPSAKPDRTIVTRMDGPEGGYVATPIMMVEAAWVVLDEYNKLPPPGVYTTALLFGNTSLLDRLAKRGITVSVVSDTTSNA